jgi:hypothetical protein
MNTDERTISETAIETVVENIMGGKKNIILDATVLTALMGCPRLMDFRFNHNFMSINGKSNSLECGSIVHKFLEVYYGSQILGIKKADAEGFAYTAAELYITGCRHCTDFVPTTETPKPICGHRINDYPGVKNTPREPDKDNPREKYKTGWKWVLETLAQYIDFYRNDHWVSLEVETVKGEVLYEDDEIRILWKAKLDWVVDNNQGIYPVDHKTMKQRRNTVSMNNQFMGQCIISKTRNVFINKIGFQKTLEPKDKFTRPPISYSASRLVEWQSETLPYYSKLLLMYAETGHFPPQFDHCEGKYGNCAFLPVCESDPGMREEQIKRMFIVGPDWNPTNDDDLYTEEEE